MVDAHLIVYGFHAVKELLATHPHLVLEIWLDKEKSDSRHQEVIDLVGVEQISLNKVDKHTLNNVAGSDKHQGVLARCKHVKSKTDKDLTLYLQQMSNPSPLFLVLDGVQDPHNLGACLRTANATAVDAIIAPRNRAVSLTPTVYKVAVGAALTIPYFQVTNLARTLKSLKAQGVWIVGADGRAKKSLYEQDLNGPLAIVLGAEGSGLRRLTREHCDFLVNIPMLGTTESLNVSVATGVFLYESLRQRHFTGKE